VLVNVRSCFNNIITNKEIYIFFNVVSFKRQQPPWPWMQTTSHPQMFILQDPLTNKSLQSKHLSVVEIVQTPHMTWVADGAATHRLKWVELSIISHLRDWFTDGKFSKGKCIRLASNNFLIFLKISIHSWTLMFWQELCFKKLGDVGAIFVEIHYLLFGCRKANFSKNCTTSPSFLKTILVSYSWLATPPYLICRQLLLHDFSTVLGKLAHARRRGR
jgi:hypothetical protein